MPQIRVKMPFTLKPLTLHELGGRGAERQTRTKGGGGGLMGNCTCTNCERIRWGQGRARARRAELRGGILRSHLVDKGTDGAAAAAREGAILSRLPRLPGFLQGSSLVPSKDTRLSLPHTNFLSLS